MIQICKLVLFIYFILLLYNYIFSISMQFLFLGTSHLKPDLNIIAILFGNKQSIINNIVYRFILAAYWAVTFSIMQYHMDFSIKDKISYIILIAVICSSAILQHPFCNESIIMYHTTPMVNYLIKPIVLPLIYYIFRRYLLSRVK